MSSQSHLRSALLAGSAISLLSIVPAMAADATPGAGVFHGWGDPRTVVGELQVKF